MFLKQVYSVFKTGLQAEHHMTRCSAYIDGKNKIILGLAGNFHLCLRRLHINCLAVEREREREKEIERSRAEEKRGVDHIRGILNLKIFHFREKSPTLQ